MTSKERLEAAFTLKKPDRTPILGGWIACPEHIMTITRTTEDQYWRDPQGVSIRAYEILGTDGLANILVPKERGSYRIVDQHSYAHSDSGKSLEDTVSEIEAMPSPEKIESDFKYEEAYAKFKEDLIRMQKRCGDMIWMPAQWEAGAKVTWFFNFGYENYFCVIGLYPDHARKLMEIGGAQGRCRSKLIARAVKEGIFPHAVFLGEDICTQRGPMVSVDFLEQYYAPQLKYGLEPLLEAGCRPVWHSDGDIRLLMDFLIDSGVRGFQGFQPECGMKLEEIVKRRTTDGEKLIIFGPLAVTTELPVCSPEQVKEKVRHAIEVCKDQASLVMFTSNTINPDVPLENIIAMHEAVREY